MRKAARARKPRGNVGIALITLAILLPLLYVGFTKSIPFRSHYEIKAAFEDANGVKSGSPVRIAGVDVGTVTGVEPLEKGGEGALVTMRVGKAGRPIHQDAQAKVRPRIFLEGNFFVDLEPGRPGGEEIEDGETIPINQTATPVQFDELLTSLQSDTREDLQLLLKEYGNALDKGGAEAFNRSIPYWKEAYRDTAIVNDAMLGRAEHDLSGYIDGAGAVAAALDRSPPQLKALITDFNITARAFAREDDNLKAAIAELPNTLRTAQPALAALNESFPPLRAFARDLTPGVRSSGPAIDASLPLVRQLRGLVSKDELRGLAADLRPTIPALARLSRESIPLSQQGRLLASCQNETVLPFTRSKVDDPAFPTDDPVFQETGKFFPGLAGESRSGDANGQWFRVLAAGGTNLIETAPGRFATSMNPMLGANPPKPDGRPPLVRDAACETQEPPDLSSKPAAPPPQQQIDPNDPKFRERYQQARDLAMNWLEEQIEREGLDDTLTVGETDVTQETLDQIQGASEIPEPLLP